MKMVSRAMAAATVATLLSVSFTSAAVVADKRGLVCETNNGNGISVEPTDESTYNGGGYRMTSNGGGAVPFNGTIHIACMHVVVEDNEKQNNACSAGTPTTKAASFFSVQQFSATDRVAAGTNMIEFPLEPMSEGTVTDMYIRMAKPASDKVLKYLMNFTISDFEGRKDCAANFLFSSTIVEMSDDLGSNTYPTISLLNPATISAPGDLDVTFKVPETTSPVLGFTPTVLATTGSCDGTGTYESLTSDKTMLSFASGYNNVCAKGQSASSKLVGRVFVPATDIIYSEVECGQLKRIAKNSECNVKLLGRSAEGEQVRIVKISSSKPSCASEPKEVSTSDGITKGGIVDEVVPVRTGDVTTETNTLRVCVRSGGKWFDTFDARRLRTSVVSQIDVNAAGRAAGVATDGRIIPSLSNLFFGLIIGGIILFIGIVALAVWSLCCRKPPAQANANFKPL